MEFVYTMVSCVSSKYMYVVHYNVCTHLYIYKVYTQYIYIYVRTIYLLLLYAQLYTHIYISIYTYIPNTYYYYVQSIKPFSKWA